MPKYSHDMCIVCFAPKIFDSQRLFRPSDEDSRVLCISELGQIYQELIQVPLSPEEQRPQFLCFYCKSQLNAFHNFKLKALDAYKSVSEDIYNSPKEEKMDSGDVKVEEVTIFDTSARNIEKFEIQYLDGGKENPTDTDETKDAVKGISGETISNVKTKEHVERNNSNALKEEPIDSNELIKQEPIETADDDEIDEIPAELHETQIQQNYTETTVTKKKRNKKKKHPHEYNYQCEQCKRTFMIYEIYQAHLRVHQGLPRYTCCVCGKDFKQTNKFMDHIKKHNGERDWKCPICGKAFVIEYHLKVHLSTHTDYRPYACDICDKRFRRTSHLTNHKYSHSEKQFECEFCKQKYSSPSILQTHIKSIHKDTL